MLYLPYPFKRCSACHEHQPSTVQFFSRNCTAPDGLHYCCKACQKGRYQANHEKRLAHVKQYKTENRDKVLESKRRSYYKHHDRIREKRKAHYRDHREQYHEHAVSNYWRDPEYHRVNSKKWRERNRDYKRQKAREWEAQNRPKLRDYSRRYHHDHPEASVVKEQRRRAQKGNLPNTFTTKQWRRCLDYFDHRCAVCDRPSGLWHRIAADHWIPLASLNCPGTVAANIVPLCHARKDGEGGCNNSKGKRDPVEWLTEKFGECKAKRILARIQKYFVWVAEQDTHPDNP